MTSSNDLSAVKLAQYRWYSVVKAPYTEYPQNYSVTMLALQEKKMGDVHEAPRSVGAALDRIA